MPDFVSPAVRSRMMAGIGPVDTRPELILRRGLHARGWRYRLHDRRLPGRPDLVFAGRNAVILVNGCFWHGHQCHLFRWPGTRAAFWQDKLGGNIARDMRTRAGLHALGWRTCEVWECMLKGRERRPLGHVLDACEAFLHGHAVHTSIGGDRRVAVPQA